MDNKEIERTLITTYRKDIKGKFLKAIKKYKLIEEGDKVAVCISGGKDSVLMAKLFQELERHGIKNFKVKYICMNPGYSEEVKIKNKKLFDFLEIPVEVFDTDVFKVAEYMTEGKNPCYMCARMRRGALYSKAKELGCNKIALGHHMDDVIETILLNIFYAGSYKTMMPKLKAKNFENMELIRPLYLIREKDIIRFTKFTGLEPIDCACEVAKTKIGSKRFEMKALLKNLEEDIPNVAQNILRSSENVGIDTVLGYKKDGVVFKVYEDDK